MKDEKSRKDEYQKALAAYAEALKEFRKGKFEKAADMLRAFLEKHPVEREVVDRAKTYLALAEKKLREPKEAASLKTADDFFHAAVFKLNEGLYEDTIKLLDKGLKLSPEDAKIHFLAAQAYALSNQGEASLDSLRKAIQADKSLRVLAQNEAAFDSLWDDKRFKLLTRIG
ncbi:MAG: hypothetical protein FJY80_06245 [Candidatus Aminicenantes bacterium]|nr:hypothetical protein [Candidatus Aminicenantes bacterium]